MKLTFSRFAGWRRGKSLCFWLPAGLLLARAVSGADALYQNDGVITFPGTVSFPPQIDATNFVNNDIFTINGIGAPYETSDTLNYTNNGWMSSDVGFWFDTQTTGMIPRQMAGNFVNLSAHEVDCGYDFLVWATNIVSPGTLNVPGIMTVINYRNQNSPVFGLVASVQFTGQNVDLTRGVVTVGGGQGSALAIGFLGQTGMDTNSDWDASVDLGPTFAFPSLPTAGLLPPPAGFGFPNLPLNTTAYFNFAAISTNQVIIRSVFVQDTSSPTVRYNVYFDSAGLGAGGGNATVEWLGGYVDPPTGNLLTNYLYLNDNYVQSVATNDLLDINGIPINFTFTQSPTQLFLGTPTTPGFVPAFFSGFVSNRFAYVSAQLIDTSVGTNAIPNGAITNLPSQIQINASGELNLELAQISQPDYLSLQATNQFDGNAGAHIAAPFSDINLGATNGFLTITNLLPQSFPTWGGTVQAWSTRWLVTTTNTLDGTNFFSVTNDFRVELVASQLAPTAPAQIRDLILRGTNSVVISDAFNVMDTLSIDAQSLTLTTNAFSYGARSVDGELNLESPNMFWASSLPNLRWLTNNGVISTANLANYGSGTQPYGAFVNRGRVSNMGGSSIWANDFEHYGTFFSGTNGSFVLQSVTTTMTNSAIIAGGDISITADSLVTSNLLWQAGRSLTLRVTNRLTDNGVTNGNVWTLGGTSLVGLNLPLFPNNPTNCGDLLGTMISIASPPPNKLVANTWAGQDRGVSNSGYTNNVAIGVLTLDALGANSAFKFNGASVSNALYVDELRLLDFASYTNHDAGGNLPALVFNTNLVLYYAQAITADGTSVAEKLDHKNNDHLRWVFSYAGYFSGTNIVYPDGSTNGPFNTALAQSPDIDSDGDGLVNGSDPTPFAISPMVVITPAFANGMALLKWHSIPLATNCVLYTTNFVTWQSLTNFVSPGTNATAVDPSPGGKFYRVRIDPWLTYPF